MVKLLTIPVSMRRRPDGRVCFSVTGDLRPPSR
jgi:hypothetical protein